MFTNILMWLGDAFLLLDMYLVGQQRRLAWVFCIVGEALWIVASVIRHLWPLTIICFAFLFLGIHNLLLWKKKREESEAARVIREYEDLLQNPPKSYARRPLGTHRLR